MTLTHKTLIHKLALVLLVKLVLLSGLWWAFVRDARVLVNEDLQAQRLLNPISDSAKGTDHDL